MLKKIFGNLVIDVKVYYTNIFLACIPFFTIIALIIIPLFQNPDFVRENRLLMFGISLVNLILFGTACMVGFYVLKRMTSSDIPGEKFLKAVTTDILEILKVVLKKVILMNLGFLLLIPGIYFFIRWYFVYPCFVFEKNKDPFDRSMNLTRQNYIFIFFLFLSFSFLFVLSLFFGGFVRLFYNSITAVPDESKFLIVVGGIVFFLLITPIIILFDYEFYLYCKEHVGDSFSAHNILRG